MKTTDLWRWGTAAFVVGSIVGTGFFSNPGRRGSSTKLFNGQQRELDQNLTTPANGTFPIAWSVIYSGTVGLVIHQALPAQGSNPRYAKARPWWLLNYALNALFGYFFSRPDKASRVGASLTTIALLPTALGLHRSLEIDQPTDVPQPERTLRRSVSLYAGWLTAATVVSAGNLLIQAGFRVRPPQAERWAYGMLPVTASLGIWIARRLNDPYYLIPFVAAFSGMAAKQWPKTKGVAALSGACALATTVALIRQLRALAGQSNHSAGPTHTPVERPVPVAEITRVATQPTG